MFTKPESINSIEAINFFKELDNFCQEQKFKKLIFLDETEICNVSFSETYRAILDFSFSNRTIRNLFISHLESIQRYSPPSVAFIPFLVGEVLKKDLDLNHDKFVKITSEPSLAEIHNFFEPLFNHSSMLTPQDCHNIFQANGFISDFSIKKSNNDQNACIFNSGFFISGYVPELFLKKSNSIEFEFTECNFVIYDSYIQEVSELNLILNLSYDKKENFVILCRGCSQDVQHTCAVNYSSGKTSVVPFCPSEEFWNTQSEIITSSCKLGIYGQTTGVLLNNFDLDNQDKINVTISTQGIFIKDKSLNLNRVADTDLYVNSHNWKKRGILEDQLTFLFSLLQQISTCGLVESGLFYKETGIDLAEITGMDLNFFPAFSIFRALNEANKIKNKILNIGYIIKCET